MKRTYLAIVALVALYAVSHMQAMFTRLQEEQNAGLAGVCTERITKDEIKTVERGFKLQKKIEYERRMVNSYGKTIIGKFGIPWMVTEEARDKAEQRLQRDEAEWNKIQPKYEQARQKLEDNYKCQEIEHAQLNAMFGGAQ